MSIAREQYDYWRSIGWSHGQMIFALGLNAPIRATEADVLDALHYAGWKMTETRLTASYAAVRARRDALYERLCAIAEVGAPLPHVTELGLATAQADLFHMRDAGLIRTERHGPRRRIQIVATGRWTGWTDPPARAGDAPLPADPEAAVAAAMAGRRYEDAPGYDRIGAVGRLPARPAAYSPSTSSAAWAA